MFLALDVMVMLFLKSPSCRSCGVIFVVMRPSRPGRMVESTPTAVHPHPARTFLIRSTELPVFVIVNTCLMTGTWPWTIVSTLNSTVSIDIMGADVRNEGMYAVAKIEKNRRLIGKHIMQILHTITNSEKVSTIPSIKIVLSRGK